MEQAREFLMRFSGPEGYFVFYTCLIACGVGAPLNSDLILIAASMLAAAGLFKLPILIPIAFLGLITGDSINFFIARKFGPGLLRRAPFKWILPESKLKQAEGFLAQKGSRFVFCIRFMPFIRTALFFTAGTLRIHPRTFYLLNGISTVIYLSILMNLAHAAGSNIDGVIAGFKRFQSILLVAALLLGTLAFTLSRRKGRTES